MQNGTGCLECSGSADLAINSLNLKRPIIDNTSQVISLLHRRFPATFTPSLISQFATSLAPPQRAQSNAQPAGQGAAGSSSIPSTAEQKEKDDAGRIARQRPALRVCSELALVGIIKDGPDRSGAEWVMKTIKELVRIAVKLHLISSCF